MKIVRMRVENRKNPLGIDEVRPTFSWNVETKERDWKQAAYELFVSEDAEEVEKAECFKRGRVESASMVNVFYDGVALNPPTI